MDERSERVAPSWDQVSAALDRAQEGAEELATTEPEKVQRRFGIVLARMELKRLFGGGEGDAMVQG